MKAAKNIVEALIEFAGPLGPLTTPQQRQAGRDVWRQQLDETDLPALIGVLMSPPHKMLSDPDALDAFEAELADALTAAGRGNPALLLASLEEPLSRAGSRQVAIAAIGTLGDPAGVDVLARVSQNNDLTADELEWLACALGDIGTAAAAKALRILRERRGADDTSVQQEIDIALERCEASPLP